MANPGVLYVQQVHLVPGIQQRITQRRGVQQHGAHIAFDEFRHSLTQMITRSSVEPHGVNNRVLPPKIALLTGGIDNHYACGLSQSLASSGVAVDVICNAEMSTREMQESENLKFFALYSAPRSDQKSFRKLMTIIGVYARLLRYAFASSAPIFHILWNYKLAVFDRTFLLFYYKLLGKRTVFTAHNVNAGERDGADSLLNRISLRIQYRLVDHVFVHTQKMKDQLVHAFNTNEEKISIIPFGTYDMVPQSTLSSAEAKQRLGLHKSDRTILFFGRITPYKGIDLLVDAFARIAVKDPSYRLVIAGEAMKEAGTQWRHVQQAIEQSPMAKQVIQHIRHIGDKEIELYFKSADVLVLPYTQIFQSGVLFMAYSFGLPVIATDVGSFGRDIIEGTTGYVCRPNDPEDLAAVIESYFSSDLFRALDQHRVRIKDFIQASHSWEIAARKTREVYVQLVRYRELQYST
jgi:D-inositol-3-phosphate glycosyltransferase